MRRPAYGADFGTMRLISLCPSTTELLCDLNCAADLVGVTKFCVHPKPIVLEIAKVGGTKNPRVDEIIRLKPDLVFLNEEENRIEDCQVLREAGVRCHVSFPKNVPDTIAFVHDVGRLVHREREAAKLAGEIQRAAENARRRAEQRRKLRFVYVIWRKPWMTVAADTYVSALLELAGGENVFGHHPSRYPTFEPSELRSLSTERVFLASEPFPFKDTHQKELQHMSGLDSSKFSMVDGELLSWHGSRTRLGLDYASRLFAAVDDAGSPKPA